MSEFRIIKDGVFPKPYDKKGLKIKLSERQAAKFVEKGTVELIEPKKPAKATKPTEAKKKPATAQKKAAKGSK